MHQPGGASSNVASRIDLGGDQVGGSKRRRPELLHRARNASGRAGMIRNLIKVVKHMKTPGSMMQKSVHKIRFFAPTNAAPSHHYGRTIIGADDRITGIHKSTIAFASGPMSIGAGRWPYSSPLEGRINRKYPTPWPPSEHGSGTRMIPPSRSPNKRKVGTAGVTKSGPLSRRAPTRGAKRPRP